MCASDAGCDQPVVHQREMQGGLVKQQPFTKPMAAMGNPYGAFTIFQVSVIRTLAFAARRADMALGPLPCREGRAGDDDLFKHDRRPARDALFPVRGRLSQAYCRRDWKRSVCIV
ncbi:protein of unknown function [Agrobacterium pusense]|uniref:Uncharacterized protein n=1 Tax=Agrobacterium pusense TaxID=648995 RepID=U4Q8T5_9HYPH|nr:protein of unknown function [Agrobacterium pusense]